MTENKEYPITHDDRWGELAADIWYERIMGWEADLFCTPWVGQYLIRNTNGTI
jgi:hypothetical protein